MSQLYFSLLVDGYISKGFGPSQAERHFHCVLKTNTIAARQSGGNGDYFVVTSIPPYIQSQFPNQHAWVLDRRVMNAGTVVPQTLWIPFTVADRRRHVQNAELQMPIFFLHMDGRLGLPLEAAVSGRCHSLLNAQYFAPLGRQTTTHIRVGWPGYQGFKRQVQIRDETHNRNTVTLSKFAHHVGRSVDAFIRGRQVDVGNPIPQWRIGDGGIRPEDIVIIGAIHVSSGSWMPILQLNNRIIF